MRNKVEVKECIHRVAVDFSNISTAKYREVMLPFV
jgi:hypothetical protein